MSSGVDKNHPAVYPCAYRELAGVGAEVKSVSGLSLCIQGTQH